MVKLATICMVLSIALSHAWKIHQLDVKNAFLHEHLDEIVYMYQPPGFRDIRYPNLVCLLKKSLYSLKEAPWAWYQRFGSYVSTLGFKHRKCDHSLFCTNKVLKRLLYYFIWTTFCLLPRRINYDSEL